MPLVRSIEQLADGMTITFSDGRTQTVTSADVPQVIRKKTEKDVEDWCNTRLAIAMTDRGVFARVRVLSKTPLRVMCAVSDAPILDSYFDG